MENVPGLFDFSAISEIFVTIGVLYGIISSLQGKKFPKAMMGGVLAFELCVNVVYMATRASAADRAPTCLRG